MKSVRYVFMECCLVKHRDSFTLPVLLVLFLNDREPRFISCTFICR